ncbi:hypothetical protein SAMN02745121_06344 [Nannocystis exedens]|uniref:Uncharacterized protein n=1 Tax=Nannocystis exedens TaxID=54 RepID=A0A1I2F0F0_9BACT|nr:hypothetical protein [Nannocystis exedens]PCC69537.1 hypothetical protein NAEX_02559 [Nannocystis exedens]SFE97990.1 hypothetical protein SAMN02745121_06344 [Nannocystis exedens]
MTRVRVWPGRDIGSADVLPAELEDAAELDALREALQIVEGPARSCSCTGGPESETFAADGRPIASLTMHMRVKLRTAPWDGDAPLRDPATV